MRKPPTPPTTPPTMGPTLVFFALLVLATDSGTLMVTFFRLEEHY